MEETEEEDCRTRQVDMEVDKTADRIASPSPYSA